MNMEFLYNLDEYIKIKQYRLVNSVLVYENDKLVFERYYNKFAPDSRNQIKSVWKSILSLVLGICLDRGFIKDIDEPVCRYLSSFNENSHPWHKFITIRHLLTMSSGIYWNGGIHYHCPMMEQMRRSRNWAAHIADIQMADMPGTKFHYKEWDVILLSALITKAGGKQAWDICSEYLYKPLQISSDKWTRSKCGIDYPSWGDDASSDLSALDMAKIGLLMLHGGMWDGGRIVSSRYANEAVKPTDAGSGYGFLWWLSDKGFHGRGFGGQELNVYPGENIVAVVQAAVTPSSKSYEDICGNILSQDKTCT